MVPKEPKLVRVELTYEDGSGTILEGEDVEKWDKAINTAIMFYATHFNKGPLDDLGLNWQHIEKPKQGG